MKQITSRKTFNIFLAAALLATLVLAAAPAQTVRVAAPAGSSPGASEWVNPSTSPSTSPSSSSGGTSGQRLRVNPGEVPDVLTAAEWETIQSAVAAAEYHFAWHAATDEIPSPYYWAPNRAQGWHTRFTPAGVQLTPRDDEDWTWGLTLTGYGYASAALSTGYGAIQSMTDAPAMQAEKDTLTYQWDPKPATGPSSSSGGASRHRLTEWWVNTPAGLEQGFTLRERPVHSDRYSVVSNRLVLDMAVTGTLIPVQAGEAILFQDADGETMLRYGRLHVTDAGGQVIPAHLELAHSQLTIDNSQFTIRIVVEDNNATYPLTIDPWTEAAKLTASDGAVQDYFGRSVATSGDTVAAGADEDDDKGNNSGSAYVFVRSAGGWTTTSAYDAKLTPSDGTAGDFFGYSVAISGDTVVVGAYGGDVGGNISQGSAYIFVKPVSGWATTSAYDAKLTASDGLAFDSFGYSVAISGDTVVAGAYLDDDSGSASGSAYVFVKPAGGWTDMTQTARLTASDGVAQDFFGFSVAISGDTVVVGAKQDDVNSNTDQGSVYVFVKPAGGWATTSIFDAKLTASDGVAEDYFGTSVAISGDTVVVGAYGDDDKGSRSGSAYVFVKPAGGWATTSTYDAKLTASDGAAADFLGDEKSVAISGDVVVAGAGGDDISGNTNQGSAYVFAKPASGWTDMTQTAKLTASDGELGDWFGESVAVSGGTVVAGARLDTVGSTSNQGSAYVFPPSYSSKTTGNWHTGSTWVSGSVPGVSNDAFISSGDTVTVDANAQARRLTVAQGATLVIPNGISLTVEEFVTNNGTMQQTQTVNNASVAFLAIQNNAGTSTQYRGVNIDTTGSGANLGSVTVAVQGLNPGEYCTSTSSSSPAYARRCFQITPATDGSATVRLWGLSDELNSITESNLSVYRNTGGSTWTELTTNRATGSDGGTYSYAEGDTTGFSSFLLGETGNTPTVITLRSLTARSALGWYGGALALVMLALGAGGLVVARRTRPTTRPRRDTK